MAEHRLRLLWRNGQVPCGSQAARQTWSASMRINMLEAGHARSKEATILNMIEWMDASYETRDASKTSGYRNSG
jgi:hypothetical protein